VVEGLNRKPLQT